VRVHDLIVPPAFIGLRQGAVGALDNAIGKSNSSMTQEERAEFVKDLRQQLYWLTVQVSDYESGRPGDVMENGIYAAHKCAEMATKYRQRADDLTILISAYEES
jgi:hypothetical protein